MSIVLLMPAAVLLWAVVEPLFGLVADGWAGEEAGLLTKIFVRYL